MNKAAQALGRLARGVPKNYSAEEIERRSKILAGINARKRAKSKKRRMPKASLTFVLFVVSVLSAQSEDTNRFTIITGATAAGYTTPNTLRLDRFTGQTFVFAFHTNSGFFWRPVSEPVAPSPEAETMNRAVQLRKFLAWADANKRGVALTNDAGEVINYTAEQVINRRAEVAADLEKLEGPKSSAWK